MMSAPHQSDRPLTILICALGGDGGGVLADWICQAAVAVDRAVQRTAIPGVAQRTGATTYYLEIARTASEATTGAEPVFSLQPHRGDVDVVLATELTEAVRALRDGFVTDRTTVVSSTRRVPTIEEKSSRMGDPVPEASWHRELTQESARAVLFDAPAMAKSREGAPNAVLLGRLVRTVDLGLPQKAFEEAIRKKGIAIEANLRAFNQGLEEDARPSTASIPDQTSSLDNTLEHARSLLLDYQGLGYVALFDERVGTLRNCLKEQTTLNEAVRRLALWMAYEDAIRVAQLKLRPERDARIREEIGASSRDSLDVIEYLSPGFDELASVLPRRLGRALATWSSKNESRKRFRLHLRLRSSTVFGFLRLLFLAKLRPLRTSSYRFHEEQALIQEWLSGIERHGKAHPDLCTTLVEAPSLLQGYGATRERGLEAFFDLIRRALPDALAEGTPQLAHQSFRDSYLAAHAWVEAEPHQSPHAPGPPLG